MNIQQHVAEFEGDSNRDSYAEFLEDYGISCLGMDEPELVSQDLKMIRVFEALWIILVMLPYWDHSILLNLGLILYLIGPWPSVLQICFKLLRVH